MPSKNFNGILHSHRRRRDGRRRTYYMRKLYFLFALLVLLIPVPAHSQGCDPELAKHVYRPKRLRIAQAMAGSCITITGVWQDASHGITRDHCRHEKDGDAHCWLKPDEEKYANAENRKSQDGNLVVETICRYIVAQL